MIDLLGVMPQNSLRRQEHVNQINLISYMLGVRAGSPVKGKLVLKCCWVKHVLKEADALT